MNNKLSVLLIVLSFQLNLYGQFGLFLTSETNVSFCEPMVIEGGIEKAISNGSSNNLKLQLESSFPLEVSSFSSQLQLINQVDNIIDFSIQSNDCDFFQIFIELIPVCNDAPQQFITTAKLIDEFDNCIVSQELFFFLSYPLVEIAFETYSYDASTNILSKTINLRNNSNKAVSQISIVPEPDRRFATLVNEPQGTTVSNDTIYINNTLKPNEAIALPLEYALNDCELRTITYDLNFGCNNASCVSTISHIDENELLSLSVSAGPNVAFNYGMCESSETEINIFNGDLGIRSAVGAIFNIKLELREQNRYSTRVFTDCFTLQGLTQNSIIIRTDIIDNLDHIVDFSSLTTDPDGPGGFSDLDGDGQYDDLTSMDSLIVNLSSIVKEDCYDQYQNGAIELQMILHYDNFCQRQQNNSITSTYIGRISDDTYFQTGIPTPENLSRDANNNFSIPVGDTFEFVFRFLPSDVINNNCASNLYLWTLDIPNNVMPAINNDFIITDEENEWTITPFAITGDTLFEFELPFDETNVNLFNRFSIKKEFIAVCIDDVVMSGNSPCEQCLEIPTHRFFSSVIKECNLNCNIPVPEKTDVSVDFRVICEDEPDLALLVDFSPTEIYNLTEGFSSLNPKVTRDAFTSPNSINNRLVFDGDTILIRFPITINCIEELERFTISARRDFLQMDMRFLDIIDATISTSTNTSTVPTCNIFNDITSEDANLFTVSFSEADIQNCFTENTVYFIDFIGIVGLNTDSTNFDVTAQLSISTRITELNKNACERSNTISRDVLFLHDVFNPEVFRLRDPFGFSNQSGFFLYQTRVHQFSIYNTINNADDFSPETKFIPVLREISIEIPNGFELSNTLNILKTNSREFDVGFNFFDIQANDTLFVLNPSIVDNANSRTYNFSYTGSEYYHDELNEGIVGSFELKAICEPTQLRVDIPISGKMEYVDYASGTLDTLLYEFNDKLQVAFIEDFYVTRDRFKNLTEQNNGIFEVAIRGNSSIFERVDNFREELETRYRFEFESLGTQIDSIVLSKNEFDEFGNSITEFLETENIFVADQTIDVRSFPGVFTNVLTGETFPTGRQFPSVFNIHTSNHPCGLDTVFFRAGLAAQFESSSCDAETIHDSQFVIFSNFGFPNIVLDSVPDFIELNGSSSILFSLENIGAAPLNQNRISIPNFENDNYTLWQLSPEGDRTLDITNLSQHNLDSLIIDLSQSNLGKLMHPGENRNSSWQFELEIINPCPVDSFLNISIQSISTGECIGNQISQQIRTPNIPYVDRNQLDYMISTASLLTESCMDTLELLLQFNKMNTSSADLSNSGIYIELANDLNIISDGVRFNNQLVNSIQTIASGNNTTTIFRIENPDVLTTAAELVLKLNGTCIDHCRGENIRAFLFSDEPINCNGSVSEIDQTRGILIDDEFKWNVGVLIDSVDLKINSIEIDSADITFRTSFSKPQGSIISNSIFVDLFNDINDNDSAENNELIDRFLLQESDFTNDRLTIDYFTKIPLDLFCSLEMSISNDSECLCTDSHIEIGNDQSIVIDNQIDFCGQSAFNIDLVKFPNSCNINQALENGIVQVDEFTLSVMPDIYSSSSLSIERTCGTCTFIENFEFINSVDNNIQIEIEQNANCQTQAIVRWADGSDITNPLSVNWDQDPSEISTMLLNPNNGLLSVVLVDSGGCEYATSLMVNIANDPLRLEPTQLPDECNLQFPISINLSIAGGFPPYQIEWSDSDTSINRLIDDPGKYFVTVTDALACSFIDSISIKEGLNFTIDLTHPTCLNPNIGSIELISNNTDLLFGLNTIGLISANTIDNLTEGGYTIFVQDQQGCLDSSTVELIRDNEYSLNIPASHQLSTTETIELNPEREEPAEALWQWASEDYDLSCDDCPDPTITALASGTVSLFVSDGECDFAQTISISVAVNNAVYVPDAFRVSSELNNNKFKVIPNSTFDRLSIVIYDQWGNLMFEEVTDEFESNDYGWDGYVNGQLASQGVYVYRAKLERNVDGERFDFVGDFILFH